MDEAIISQGFCIVVLDKGFVYAGDLTLRNDQFEITDAQNIRYWGTTNGLGELAQQGPTEKTILDYVGTVRGLNSAICHWIPIIVVEEMTQKQPVTDRKWTR